MAGPVAQQAEGVAVVDVGLPLHPMVVAAAMAVAEKSEFIGGKGGGIMRAAQIQNNIVINYAEVGGFDGATFIAPGNSVIGSTWNGAAFTPPPPPLVVVPQSITMRQARLALLSAGLLTSVNATVANMTGAAGQAAQITWEFSSVVNRNDALVLALGPAMGMTGAQMDALFIAGDKL